MRVIVALFKFLIGGGFLLYTFGFAFVLGLSLAGFGGSAAARLFGGIGIFWALIAFTTLVLFTGVAAILVSAHDRLCEMVEALQERNALARDR